MGTAAIAPGLAQHAPPTAFEQGLIAYQSGQFQAAMQHWEAALQVATDPAERAQVWGNLAIAYYETGRYRQALEANQTALTQFTDLGWTGAVGQVQGNLGNLYQTLGKYDRAVESYQASLAIARSQSDDRAAGVTLGNLGYVYFLQGDRTQAFAAYDESLALARQTGDREGEAHRLLNLGIAHHAENELDSAISLYTESLAVAQAIGHRTLEARILGNWGLAEAEQGAVEAAIARLEESLMIAQALGNPDLIARTQNNLGHTLLAANRLEEAERQVRGAIAQMDALRANLEDGTSVALFDTQIYTYNLLTQILVAQKDYEAALEAAEAGRARAFNQLLIQRLTPNPAQRRTDLKPMTVEDIRQLAKRTNATLVEYALVPEEDFRVQGRQRGRTCDIHIWVIQPDGTITFRQQAITAEAPQLQQLVTETRKSLGVGDRGLGAVAIESPTGNPEGYREALRSLHDLLIAPISDLLPTDPNAPVVMVPQEELFLVSFPALLSAEQTFLVQQHTVLTAPSLQALNLTPQQQGTLRSAPASPDEVLIVGNPTMPAVWDTVTETLAPLNPLPGAEQEALTVANLLQTQALIGGASAESVVKTRMETARIIHLATHGLLDYGNPVDSGVQDIPGAIALTPDDTGDGLLTAAEILDNLSLAADLVVLSACDTGRGEITGDGVIGLSRSLLGAGAKSVVVSLWSVPDAPTADLMGSFYAALAQGQTKAQALRQAMLETLANHPNPRDWAAFTLIGRP
jgi:CHAT domain-containing protein